MKKNIDIPSLLSKISIKKLEPGMEKKGRDLLITYFSDFDLLNQKKNHSLKILKNQWYLYVTAWVLIAVMVFSVIYSHQTQAMINNLPKTIPLIRINYPSIILDENSIIRNPRIRTFYSRNEKFAFNPDSFETIVNASSRTIKLKKEEIKLAKRILSENKLLFDAFQSNNGNEFSYSPLPSNDPKSFYIPDNTLEQHDYSTRLGYGSIVGSQRVVSVWSTDPIINMIGLQYADTETRYAYIKIQPSEVNPINPEYTYDAFLVVNLKEQKIEGPEFFERKIPLTQLYYKRILEWISSTFSRIKFSTHIENKIPLLKKDN